MNFAFYVTFAVLAVTVTRADEPRIGKQVDINAPYLPITDAVKYSAVGGFDNQQQQYRQPAYNPYYGPQPYDDGGYGGPLVPYTAGYVQPSYGGYPYGYPDVIGSRNPLSGPYPARQAPPYPSPGAQPLWPPVPHPFYHVQGAYYPPPLYTNTTTTTEANTPATEGPKENAQLSS